MAGVQYESFTEARTHFRQLLDAADDGWPASIHRESQHVAVVDAERLRDLLHHACEARAELVAYEADWVGFLPGLPISATGATPADALDGLIQALREYATDWCDHLRTATNHRDNWDLVQLIGYSTDQQLMNWLATP